MSKIGKITETVGDFCFSPKIEKINEIVGDFCFHPVKHFRRWLKNKKIENKE